MRSSRAVDRLGERPAPEVIPEPAQLRETLARELLLRLQLVRQHACLGQLALERGQPLALVAFEVRQLRLAFAILLLPREFGSELLQALATRRATAP